MELDCTYWCCFLFVKDTANTESYTYGHTLSLHDALPICLDDDPQFLAQEIGDKIGNRRLPAEFEAQKQAPPKHSPERLLGFGFASPQFADYDSRWFMPTIGHIPSPATPSEQVRKSRFLSLGRDRKSVL